MSLKKMMNFIKFHFFSNKFKISQINVKKKKKSDKRLQNNCF